MSSNQRVGQIGRSLQAAALRAARELIFACAAAVILPCCIGQLIPVRASGSSAPKPGEAGAISLSDALKTTLQRHPLLSVQHLEVTAGQAARQQASGQFDYIIGSSMGQQNTDIPLTRLAQTELPTGLQAGTTATGVTAYNFNVAKQFRNGLSISTFTTLNRTRDNLFNRGGLNTSQSGVQLIMPLMQGRGRDVTGAKELAAGIETNARRWDLRQTAEQLVVQTAISYWNLVAANKQLVVAKDSEERGRLLVETVSALIQADQRPRNDIYEAKATLAMRTAERVAAEQTLAQARQQLALDMGLPPSEILRVRDTQDDLPEISELGLVDNGLAEQYIALALQNRPDVAAAQERADQAKILLHAAEQLTKPQVNLQLSTGYEQLAEGNAFKHFFGSWFTNLHSPDFQAGIVYQFPTANNLALGQRLQARAQSSEAELRVLETKRQIAASVTIASEKVQGAALQSASIHEAVTAFQRTLDGEREKYRMGESSMTELLTVEDRLTAALNSEVQAELDYAVALASLRLAMGSVLQPGNPLEVDARVFQKLPGVKSEEGP